MSKCPTYFDLDLCLLTFSDGPQTGPVPGLVDWEIIHKKMPWGVLVLIGGSFALADAAKVMDRPMYHVSQ